MTTLTRRASAVLKQAVWAGRHPTGLEVWAVPTPGLCRSYGLFAARYGSVASRFVDPATGEACTVPDGIAHFLEHRLFEQQDETDATDGFAALGASTNAYTWYTQTAYLFSTVEHPRACLDLLLDFVQEPHFRAERVEREKGIIREEIRMYDDDPYHRGFRALMAALYQAHPVRQDIAGTVDTIAAITPADLDRCWRAFYHPANMVLVVAGALAPEDVAAAVDSDLAARPRDLGRRVDVLTPEEPDAPGEAALDLPLPIARTRLLLGVKEPPLGRSGPELVRRTLAAQLGLAATFGRTAEAYDRWYRAGLIDDSFGAHHVGEAGFAFVQVCGDTDAPEALAEAVWGEVERVRREGIDPADIERARRAMLGRLLRAWDAPERVAGTTLEYALHDVGVTDLPDIFLAVTPDEVAARLGQAMVRARSTTAILRPR